MLYTESLRIMRNLQHRLYSNNKFVIVFYFTDPTTLIINFCLCVCANLIADKTRGNVVIHQKTEYESGDKVIY